MDSGLREILREHRFRISSVKNGFSCSCGYFDFTNTSSAWEKWLDHIEEIKRQRSKTRGKGMEHFPVPDGAEQAILPPQRSMTPEESANLAAYHKTKFKRVPAQDDGLPGEVPIIHGRAELAAHDAALRASVREGVLHEVIQHYGDTDEEFLNWLIDAHDTAHRALASEKAAPEYNK